jgi:hypothetical protein
MTPGVQQPEIVLNLEPQSAKETDSEGQARSSVWLERYLDTVEVNGSSPFGPTNVFLQLRGIRPKTLTHNPTHSSLHRLGTHAQGRQERSLCRQRLVAVLLRVQIQCRLNTRMSEDALHGLGFDLRLVHQPIA